MIPPRMGGFSRRRQQQVRAWCVTTLLGLGLVLLVVGDLPVVHRHDGPGVYNEECPLARLATTGPRASVSPVPDLSLILRTRETVPVAERVLLTSFSPASFDPRAPPSGHRSLSAR
jgi:hypothetical protein